MLYLFWTFFLVKAIGWLSCLGMFQLLQELSPFDNLETRWGVFPFSPTCEKLDEGLTYLHEHRIAHGDIKEDNILVNHAYNDIYDSDNYCRQSLRSQGKLTYAFYDFDGSTMFPPSMSLDECRLPSSVSYNTFYDQVPGDTQQGELDFNPFAFDVGMLGVMFCQEFQIVVIVCLVVLLTSRPIVSSIGYLVVITVVVRTGRLAARSSVKAPNKASSIVRSVLIHFRRIKRPDRSTSASVIPSNPAFVPLDALLVLPGVHASLGLLFSLFALRVNALNSHSVVIRKV
ncbi:hypothetical protein C0995_007642 [Termitomyces sp. Mi166|nr:hypothetical protein C0995_007642 [Termitomyces sp. Mi166\